MPVMKPAQRPIIGLCMIVKNEAPVIARLLRSVTPLIGHWTIVDTGSTDDTREIIRKTAEELNIPGQLHERPWRNFGHNRSEAIELAKNHCDYLFFIDADEILMFTEHFSLPLLTADAYAITMVHGSMTYSRTCLVNARLPWRYEGVLHEYLECDRPVDAVHLQGLSVLYSYDGARSRNPRKFHDDAEVLEAAVRDEPENARYQYYLAQSWRDAGEIEKAIQVYRRRAEMSGWYEETWHAKYQVARLLERAGYPEAEVVNAHLQAYDCRPSRAEPLVWLGAYLRNRGRWPTGHAVMQAAMAIATTTDRLFVELDCYGWRRMDEYALTLFYTGHKPAARKIWQDGLANGAFPAGELARIHANVLACGS